MKMDKYISCIDFLLYSTFGISIREGAMSEDEIIDKLIESAYKDATRQGALYALIKKEYGNNLKEKANEARDEAKKELKNKISKFNTCDEFNNWYNDLCEVVLNLDIAPFVWFAHVIEWEFPNFSVDKCYENLLKMQDIIDKYGKVQGTIHRYLIVAQK